MSHCSCLIKHRSDVTPVAEDLVEAAMLFYEPEALPNVQSVNITFGDRRELNSRPLGSLPDALPIELYRLWHSITLCIKCNPITV
jgi:hypothetical protein